MKKSITVILTIVILVLSIGIVPTTARYVNNTPSSYWCGSDATGLYLTINPVKSTSLKYRVFINYRKNYIDNPSKWIAVADYSLSKSKKVHITLPSAVRKLNTAYINYTVRTWTKNSAGKTVYTSDFVRNNKETKWSRFYKVNSALVSRKNLIINLQYPTYAPGSISRYNSVWRIFVKNSKGNWIAIGSTTEKNYTISSAALKKYTYNNKVTITVREYDNDNPYWMNGNYRPMGGFCNPAVSVVLKNGKYTPYVVNKIVK